MTLAEAYQIASSKGHQVEFCEAFYSSLNKRHSEEDAINEALSKIESIQSPNNSMIVKNAYAISFQQALQSGASEAEARMMAIQSVPRRKG